MKPEQLAYIMFYVSYNLQGHEPATAASLAKTAAKACVEHMPK